MGWRLANSLVTLTAEVDALAPDRSKRSDGSIGDVAHRDRCSGHNPNDFGVVTAKDITHDPEGGCNIHAIADEVVADPHPELRYVISNRRVAGRFTDWRWHRYAGSNGHVVHAHFAAGTGSDCEPRPPYDSGQSWGIYRPDTPEEAAAMIVRTNRELAGIALHPDGSGYWVADEAGGVFSFGDAAFHGSIPQLVSEGKVPASRPRCTGIIATVTGNGYWLVDVGGGVYSFGDAAFHGSVPGARGQGFPLPVGGWDHAAGHAGGYVLLHRDGVIATFDADFHGRPEVVRG